MPSLYSRRARSPRSLAVSLCLAGLAYGGVAHAGTLTVTSLADTGTGTLRAAITTANAASGATTINFSVSGTISPASALPTLTAPITISGPGATMLTIDGAGVLGTIFHTTGTVAISGLTLTNGTSIGTGGAIEETGGSLTVQDCVLTTNAAASGGGGIYASAPLTVARTTFSHNQGGGAAIYATSSVTVTDSTMSDNTSTAILFSAAGQTFTMDRCTVSGNSNTAGVAGFQLQGGAAKIANSTFSGNTGTTGNDIRTSSDGVTLDLLNVTTSGTAGTSLVVDHAATVTVRNTLFGGTNTQCKITAGTFTSLGHNLSTDATCQLTATGDLPSTDPMLGALASNGGPTQTQLPAAASPAINDGDDTGLDTTDQRGFPRIVGPAVDIGAVERNPPVIGTQPVGATVAVGQPFTLQVVVDGPEPVTYRWRLGGTPLPGATGSSYDVASATLADAGDYDVVVTDADGTVTSSTAIVVVTTTVPDAGDAGGGSGSDAAAGTDASGAPDASATQDASANPDAASEDAATSDGAVAQDAESTQDAASAQDASSTQDAEALEDAAGGEDATAPEDAGSMDDATATGAGADAGAQPVSSSSGCSCQTAGTRTGSAPALLLAALVWTTVRRRRAKRTTRA